MIQSCIYIGDFEVPRVQFIGKAYYVDFGSVPAMMATCVD